MAQHGGKGDRVPADVWQKDDRTGEWLLKVGKSAYRISDPAVPPSAGRWRRQRAHRQREQVHLARPWAKEMQPAATPKGSRVRPSLVLPKEQARLARVEVARGLQTRDNIKAAVLARKGGLSMSLSPQDPGWCARCPTAAGTMASAPSNTSKMLEGVRMAYTAWAVAQPGAGACHTSWPMGAFQEWILWMFPKGRLPELVCPRTLSLAHLKGLAHRPGKGANDIRPSN